MKAVFIVGSRHLYGPMFKKFGWALSEGIKTADLVQFTGGADVNPALYKERPHKTTTFNIVRDRAEMHIFEMAQGKPMAGICRGAQFLNIMCGGALWQDVDGHAILGVHRVQDIETEEFFNVTSTHHQLIRPTTDALLVLAAAESKRRTSMSAGTDREITIFNNYKLDTEACFYAEQQVFCFQPHPEFTEHTELAERYMNYLNKFLGV